MRCIRCQRDSRQRERSAGRCPGCHQPFAFEPQRGDLVTDAGFLAALEAVSAGGRLRWGVEHLYYEINRRQVVRRRRQARTLLWVAGGAALVALFGAFVAKIVPLAVIGTAAAVFTGGAGLRARPGATVPVDLTTFNRMWARWKDTHGPTPKGVIVRPESPPPPRPVEPDVALYSFDRAVVCDRARTVDLLLANNFHFENNCAVLSAEGYPPGPFETVRAMLRRNPRLHVFALHDATRDGCRLAERLAHDPAWFAGQATITDVGLRPGHARPLRGLFLAAQGGPPAAGPGIGPAEAEWLGRYRLELAAIRPEQVLKRLYRAINRKASAGSDASSGGSDGGGGNGGGDHRRVERDEDTFGEDAGDLEGGADGFG